MIEKEFCYSCPPPDGWLSKKEAAEYIGHSLSWLERHNVPYTRFGAYCRRHYNPTDLEKYRRDPDATVSEDHGASV